MTWKLRFAAVAWMVRGALLHAQTASPSTGARFLGAAYTVEERAIDQLASQMAKVATDLASAEPGTSDTRVAATRLVNGGAYRSPTGDTIVAFVQLDLAGPQKDLAGACTTRLQIAQGTALPRGENEHGQDMRTVAMFWRFGASASRDTAAAWQAARALVSRTVLRVLVTDEATHSRVSCALAGTSDVILTKGGW